jgi:hypothetical protein
VFDRLVFHRFKRLFKIRVGANYYGIGPPTVSEAVGGRFISGKPRPSGSVRSTIEQTGSFWTPDRRDRRWIVPNFR